MKDTISIIFASIFLVLVIVILPLFSILDRQDNIAYNVVLTQTSKFVDEIRANGFVTENQYMAFLSSLAATGNTYKVTLEAYKHTLIPSTTGTHEYQDELELYNTKDVADYLTNNAVNEEVEESNRKENVYLFEKTDEIYVNVYNTNITAGSVMYNMLMGAVNPKVIDIKYGGVVNNVNWELYNKIIVDTIAVPKVILSVPVNAENSINIVKLMTNDELKAVECIVEDYGGLFATPKEMCEDIPADSAYKYIYDLQEEKNRTIKIAAKFEDVTQVQTSPPNLLDHILYDIFSYSTWEYVVDNDLLDKDATDIANRSQAEQYIIDNYIALNGIEADINLTTNGIGDKHDFNIELTNVKIATVDALTEVASVSVLPGLGRNDYHDLTIGDETIKFEVTTKSDKEDIEILGPYNWKQLLKVKTINATAIATDPVIVFRNQEIFFRIQYSGFAKTPNEMAVLFENKLKFVKENVTKTLETSSISPVFYTPQQMREQFGVTVEGDCIIVKVEYTDSHDFVGNRYLYLDEKWIETMPEEYSQEIYYLDRDTATPNAPYLLLDGVEGNNGWYISDVAISVSRLSDKTQTPSVSRQTSSGEQVTSVSSGIWRTTATMSGAQNQAETDLDQGVKVTTNGTTTVKIKTEDYADNSYWLPTRTIKVDKEKPSTPNVSVPAAPASGWYTSNVTITVGGGTDNHSGFDKTTYLIEGANATGSEKTYTGPITLTGSGISKVTIKNYDKAGNTSTVTKEIKIDKGEPAAVSFENINGLKRTEDTEWYYTEVETRITVHYTGSATQSTTAYYEVLGEHPITKTSFEGTIKDLKLAGNGTHTIKVYTYTTTGNEKVSTHVVKIDEDAPNDPNIELEGTKGVFDFGDEGTEESAWYTTDVTATITLNGDYGTSGVEKIVYTTQYGDEEPSEEISASDGSVISFSREGITLLTVKISDAAGNESIYQEYIRIDKSAPTAAEIVISAIEGENGWYKSGAYISYTGQEDEISDISYVTIELQTETSPGVWVHESTGIWNIDNNTKGKKVILTTYNGAALFSKTEKIIRTDSEFPKLPSIAVTSDGIGPGESTSGVYMMSSAITATITPGTEYITGGNESGIWKTTYKVTSGESVIIPETVGTSVTVSGVEGEDNYYSIVATTYDYAGNKTEETKAIRICRKAPENPEIVAINGANVDGGVARGLPGAGNIILTSTIGVELKAYVNGSCTATINGNSEDISFSSISSGTYFQDGNSYSVYVIVTDVFGRTAISNSVTYICKVEED
ncbi:MAG: hypothetical protein IKL68_00465 [Clostridia bacterium]|nr:hypothetical protein [Clostridia bacterium]